MLAEWAEANKNFSAPVLQECQLLLSIANIGWYDWIFLLGHGKGAIVDDQLTMNNARLLLFSHDRERKVITKHYGPMPHTDDAPVPLRPLTTDDIGVCLKSPAKEVREFALRLLTLIPLSPVQHRPTHHPELISRTRDL